MSQIKCAELIGISSTALSNYETGKKKPGLDTIAKIVKALDISIDYLCYGTNPQLLLTNSDSYGENLINSIVALWEKDMIDYIGSSNQKTAIFLKNADPQILKMWSQIQTFEQQQDMIPDPDSYKKTIINSSIEIVKNNEIYQKKINEKLAVVVRVS